MDQLSTVDQDATRDGVRSVLSGMRCVAKCVGAGLVLIAATACAGPASTSTRPAAENQSPGSSAPSTDAGIPAPPGLGTPPSRLPPIPPGPPRQVVPEGSSSVPVSQVDASALPDGYPREVYTGNGGTVLSIKAQEGGCGHAFAQRPQESARQVVVNLSETPAEPGEVCTMDIRNPVVTVPLNAPLGERTVVLKFHPSGR